MLLSTDPEDGHVRNDSFSNIWLHCMQCRTGYIDFTRPSFIPHTSDEQYKSGNFLFKKNMFDFVTGDRTWTSLAELDANNQPRQQVNKFKLGFGKPEMLDAPILGKIIHHATWPHTTAITPLHSYRPITEIGAYHE